MRAKRRFLDRIYEAEGPEETRELYRDWSDSYDAEVADSGYVTPRRCAAALARFADDPAAPLLDVGCGTGLSGAALRGAGFATIDGADFSEEMLAQAWAKGIYRNLIRADLTQPLPFEPGDYANIAAVGVFSPGHAPPATVDALMGLLPRGGCFAFSLNDHAMAERGYLARIAEQVDCGVARVEFKDYGAHLPKIGVRSVIYVLRRTR